ncbi:MAG: AMP-binding protein [Clostridia bacterium]|nr:AMP-binding protein [Clostridia bacterium]
MLKNYKHNYPLKEVKYTPNMKVVIEDSIKKQNEFGQDIAFRYRKGTQIVDVSFEQFYLDTKYIGSAFTKLGFKKGSKIAVIGPNSYEWITAFVSVLNSEAIFVPVDKELPVEEIAYIINDSGTDMFFFASVYEEKIKANIELFSNVKYFVNFDAKEDDGQFLSYKKLMETGKELFEGGYTEYTDMTPAEDELKMIVYTSGTTGTAKGVMLSLANVMSAQNYGLKVSSTAKTMINVLPLHHTFGGLVDILVGIKCGTTMGINDSIRNILPNFKAYKPEAAMLVPLFVEKFYQ